MKYQDLQFLLKLSTYQGKVSPGVSFRKEGITLAKKVFQSLGDDDLVDFDRKVEIAPAGKALLSFDASQLPISDQEIKVLARIERAPGALEPSKIRIKKINVAKRNEILQALGDRGLIKFQDKMCAISPKVWITTKGRQCLEQINEYFQSLRKSTSAALPEKSQAATATTQPTTQSSTPGDSDVLEAIKQLDRKHNTDNFLPLFYLRDYLKDRLSREELDHALFRLQKKDAIELEPLAEPKDYTSAQINAAIYDSFGTHPLFFAIVN
ncbi:hypothetical protein Pse7367_3819 (plasmid) [Thalassoporum mexicanum PCC 7367]|uniref:hypothetical protein n=1 Tax=Thalassoporum mexicanum TaxID=3457544 RepID=UPI00029FFC96|nr:hypothetical protein [Pseudanabaena sp. PCC 7367]AFY72042.1 hypothetical protein Pse7367_3819 [Pseudanabaena sp. PCC 7367]